MHKKEHLIIIVHGLVQRVSFRASTKAVADQLGVKGLVKNMPDKTVYIEAEGDSFALKSLLEWCGEGPDEARVERVEHYPGAFKDYSNFVVLKK